MNRIVRRSGLTVTGMLAVLAVACGGSSVATDGTAGDDDPKAPCSSYVAAYARCQSKLGSPAVASEKVGATRASLTAHLAAAKTDEQRAKIARDCQSGLTQLRSVCP
jgi:hypothetical protein